MENHDAVINNSALQAYPNANIKFNFYMKFNSIEAATDMKIAKKTALNQLRNPDTNIKFKLRMKFKSIQAATDMKNSVKTTLTQQRRA